MRMMCGRFSPARVLTLAVVATLPTAVALPAGPARATTATVMRVSGADRYATAAAIAQTGWPNALRSGSTVLVAAGTAYPDGVAGGAAAGHLGVPLLLSTPTGLSSAAADQIRRLHPASVTLLGGTAALSNAVSAQAAALGVQVNRWSGTDRFGTAAAVSKATYPNGASNVYLASGLNFPDALSGAALAAVAGGPLLLTNPVSLPQATASEIARVHPSAIVVLGGTTAVSTAVANAAVSAAGGAQLSRISGPDRYQTADAVANVLTQVHGGQASNGVLVASGLNFPDALAGAAWAGASNRPVLLVPGNFVTAATAQELKTLAPTSAFVLGGTTAISAEVATGIGNGNPPTTAPAPPPPVTGSTDWPTYHHDNQRSGVATATPAFSSFHSAWNANLDGAVYGQPLVIGSTVVAATEGGSVYGLSLSSGAVLWKRHVADPAPLSSLPCGDINPLGITSTPAYDAASGNVLVLSEQNGGHHVLAGVRVSDGALAFSRTLDPLVGTSNATQQRSALLVANGRVYVAFGGLAGDCGQYIGQVVSIAANGTGTPIGWHVPTSREGGIWAPAGPVENSDGTVFVAAGNGASDTTFDGSDSVSRLSATLARLDFFAPSVWASDNDGDLDLGSSSPVLVGGKVLIAGKRGTAYLLDPAHMGGIGGQLSSASVCKPFGGAAVNGNVAYLPCNSGGVAAVSVSGTSMHVDWRAAVSGSPVYANGTLYVADSGSLYAVDASNGNTRAHIGVGSLPHFPSPTLSGKYAFVGTLSGVAAVTVG